MFGFTQSTASWSGQFSGLKLVALGMRSPRLPQSLPQPLCPQPLSNPRPPHLSRPLRPVPRPHLPPLPIADTWRPGAVCNSGERFTISFRCVAVALKSLYSCGWHMMLEFKPIKALLFGPSSKMSTLRFSNMTLCVPSAYWSSNTEYNSICLVM